MSKKNVTQDTLIVDIIELMGKRTGTYKWEVHFKKESFPAVGDDSIQANWFYVILTLGDLKIVGEGYGKTKRGALRLFLRQLKSYNGMSIMSKDE